MRVSASGKAAVPNAAGTSERRGRGGLTAEGILDRRHADPKSPGVSRLIHSLGCLLAGDTKIRDAALCDNLQLALYHGRHGEALG